MTRRRAAYDAAGLVLAVLFAFPVYWLLTTSLKPTPEILTTSYDLVPSSLTLDHYATAVGKPGFTTYLRNSLFVSIAAVACALVVALLAATALARLRFRGRRGFLVLVMVAQMAPFEALLIPVFVALRDLDLVDRLPALVLVYFVSTLPFTVWTLRGFVAGIPYELEEAAQVDGCSRTGAFVRVTLPLLGPGLVATSIFGFITAWNEFLYALVLMRAKENQTLPVWLASFRTAFGTDWGGAMAASVLFTLPVLVFFLIVQRRMVAGLTAGAVKG